MANKPLALRDYDLDRLSAYELIEILDELFPRLLPIPDKHTTTQIWHEAGRRELIETLKQLKEREQNG